MFADFEAKNVPCDGILIQHTGVSLTIRSGSPTTHIWPPMTFGNFVICFGHHPPDVQTFCWATLLLLLGFRLF